MSHYSKKKLKIILEYLILLKYFRYIKILVFLKYVNVREKCNLIHVFHSYNVLDLELIYVAGVILHM